MRDYEVKIKIKVVADATITVHAMSADDALMQIDKSELQCMDFGPNDIEELDTESIEIISKACSG